jgi:hypothetical protein
MAQEPQVKGVWFVTARRLVLRDHGEDTLQAIARAMSKPEVLLEPMPSTWYHEDHFQDALHAHMLVLARQDTRVFAEFIEACTVLGVNTFFRILLRITSPAFLMRKMPSLSRQYRRNDWTCTVTADEQQATMTWTGVPYLADRVYRLYMVAMVVKCCELCTGRRPRCQIVSHGADHATLEVVYAPAA